MACAVTPIMPDNTVMVQTDLVGCYEAAALLVDVCEPLMSATPTQPNSRQPKYSRPFSRFFCKSNTLQVPNRNPRTQYQLRIHLVGCYEAASPLVDVCEPLTQRTVKE
jgi:hypothetical protein